MKFILLTIASIFLINLNAQSLAETLWKKLETCHQYFEDMDDDGKKDFNKVDDAKNGYLHVAGDWPTCGCGCDATIAAFKDAKGKYTYIKEEIFNCSWQHELTSNRKIEDVFPKDFGFHLFTGETKKYTATEAHFIVNATIPQFGTDMKVEINIIPIGLETKYTDPLAFGHEEGENLGEKKSLNALQFMSRGCKDEQVFDYIRKGEFDKISAGDQKQINEELGESYGNFKDMEELKKYVNQVYEIYQKTLKIKYSALILGWNKSEGRFYVKSKEDNTVKYSSFRDFIEKATFWAVMC